MHGRCLNIAPRFGLPALLPTLPNKKLYKGTSPNLFQDCPTVGTRSDRLCNVRLETLEIEEECDLIIQFKLIHGHGRPQAGAKGHLPPGKSENNEIPGIN
jgi:hypothetical protein